MAVYRCDVCDYLYDEEKEGTAWADLPDDLKRILSNIRTKRLCLKKMTSTLSVHGYIVV